MATVGDTESIGESPAMHRHLGQQRAGAAVRGVDDGRLDRWMDGCGSSVEMARMGAAGPVTDFLRLPVEYTLFIGEVGITLTAGRSAVIPISHGLLLAAGTGLVCLELLLAAVCSY